MFIGYMDKNIVIIHYNTPRLTECLVRSINKFVDGAVIYIFDNSDRLPFVAGFPNVNLIDNTHGQIIDFDKWLEGYPSRLKSSGRDNGFASAKHAYSVEKCMELIPDGFVLIDSDVLLKKDISGLYVDELVYVSEVLTQPDGIIKRVCPYLCYINCKLCKENGVHFFKDDMMHGLNMPSHGDRFDTGAALYYASSGLRHGEIKTSEWCIHYGHGSWVKKGHENVKTPDEWLEENSCLWDEISEKDKGRMKYITLAELSDTIRKNIWKIPRDIDFIIGVPRSGMIGASIISSFLNVPLIDVESYLAGMSPWGGNRLRYFKEKHKRTGKVLVVDDTVASGTAMKMVKEKLSGGDSGVTFVYMCLYLEGRGDDAIDLYLEDVRKYTDNFSRIVVYEWNIMQHHSKFMEKCLYDMDGVFCVDPPDERNEEEYQKYIMDAIPLFIPRTKIGGIMTYRLIKNMKVTQEWLKRYGITYNELSMFNADSWQQRKDSGISPEMFKGEYYRTHDNYQLFVESNDHQARGIHEISGKPVYCVETNKMYQ